MQRSGFEEFIELILGITGIMGCIFAVAWTVEWVIGLLR